jgi:hypothetical protein
MRYKNEFSLHGTVKSFNEKTRFLLLEYSGPYQSGTKSTCPILVRGACVLPPDKDIEAGQNVFVVGQITDYHVGKTLIPRLIADEISRDDEGDENEKQSD